MKTTDSESEVGPHDPEEMEAAGAPAVAEISADTRLGPVHLTVSDLARSVDYYEQTVGLERLALANGTAALGLADRSFSCS